MQDLKKRKFFLEDIRKHGINLIDFSNLKNILVFSHDKDKYETPKTLSFLLESGSVNFINLSNSSCKAKLTLGKYHGLPLTKCFAETGTNQKEIIKFLEGIF